MIRIHKDKKEWTRVSWRTICSSDNGIITALLIMESSWSIGGIRERDMDNGFFIFARIER